VTVKILTTLTAASGGIASRTICLGRRGLANPRRQSRTGPEDNAGLTVTAPIGLRHAVHSVTAEVQTPIGTTTAASDHPPTPNLAARNPTG